MNCRLGTFSRVLSGSDEEAAQVREIFSGKFGEENIYKIQRKTYTTSGGKYIQHPEETNNFTFRVQQIETAESLATSISFLLGEKTKSFLDLSLHYRGSSLYSGTDVCISKNLVLLGAVLREWEKI